MISCETRATRWWLPSRRWLLRSCDPAAVRDALARAFADALGTARALAAAAGARLGQVIGIEAWDRPDSWNAEDELALRGPRFSVSARHAVRVAATVTVRRQLVPGTR